MYKGYNKESEIRQRIQRTTTTSCSPILGVLSDDFAPLSEHRANNNSKEGCKGQRKKKIINRAA